MTGSKILNLRYHKFYAIFTVVNTSYHAFVLVMVFLSVYLRSGVAVIAGKVVGDGLMLLANTILAPSADAIAVLDASLEAWTSEALNRKFLLHLADNTSQSLVVNDIEFGMFKDECENGKLKGFLQDAVNMRSKRYYLVGGLLEVEHRVSWLCVKTVFVGGAEPKRFAIEEPQDATASSYIQVAGA